MQEHDLSYVRMEMINARAAPVSEKSWTAWIRKNLFANPTDSAMTLIALAAILYFLPPMLNWLFLSA